jgi:predicted GNAT family N-acyltransferase
MFRIATSVDDLIKVFVVRGIVFVEEQHCAYAEEMDKHEFSVVHVLGEVEGEPVAAGRIRFVDRWSKLERIAVRKAYRKLNYGHQLVDFMIAQARQHGFQKIKMHAQAHLVNFYQVHGFKARGEIFQEAGIDHYLMVLGD